MGIDKEKLRRATAWAEITSGQVPVGQLIGYLNDSDSGTRQFAAKALRDVSSEYVEATLALVRALKDPSEDVREEAADSLVVVGSRAPVDTIRGLAEALRIEGTDAVVHRCLYAIELTLEKLSEPGAAVPGVQPAVYFAVSVFIAILHDKSVSHNKRYRMCWGLRVLYKHCKERRRDIVAALKETMKDEDRHLAFKAERTLGGFSEARQP